MLKFAVVGTGWIVNEWVDSALASKQWELVAVYSRNEESGKTFGKKYGVSTVYTTFKDLIAAKDVEVVYVASPNSLHYEHTKELLEGGKNVVLEKPATSTTAELDEIFQIAHKKGLFLIEAYRHIQEANFKALKKTVIDEKKLGPIYGASLQFAQFSSRYHDVLAGQKPNIFTLKFSGGSLVDVGVYPVTFAVRLFGKPKSQVYHPHIAPTGVDGGGSIILQYDNFSVQINQSKVYHSFAPAEIYGEKGTIILNATASINSIKFYSNKTKETEDLPAGPKSKGMLDEEAVEIGRIIREKDQAAADDLEQLSKDVLAVTTDLRKQNGIVFETEQQK